MRHIFALSITILLTIALISCAGKTPTDTVDEFLHARSKRDAKIYLLNRSDGALLKRGQHNLFQPNGNYAIGKVETLEPNRVAVWVSGVYIAGFIDKTSTIALQVVRTPNGWKIDLARSLLDPKLRIYEERKKKRQKKTLQQAIKIIRRACMYYKKRTNTWPSNIELLKRHTPYGIPERVNGYVFKLNGGNETEPRVLAIPEDPNSNLPAYESDVIGNLKQINEQKNKKAGSTKASQPK